MKIISDERGQAMVLMLLSMSLMLGFVALAVDVGTLFRAKREMQIAADAGAIAGALELNYGDVTAAAQAATAQNGVTSGVAGNIVAVNNPPLNGPHTGDASYVEVIVSQSQPTIFMNMIKSATNYSSINVAARAVAFSGAPATACVYVLSPTASGAMALQGSFDVSVPSCGIIVDSSASDALTFTGAGGSLTAQSIGVVGGDSGHTGDSTPAPVTGIAPESDPLGSLPAPAYNPSSCAPPPGTGNWGPSTPGGVVCYSGNVSINNATMNPGVYVFTGNVSFSGAVTGTGVTLYLQGSLDASNGTLNLTAPTSGTYNGILIFAARNNSNQLLFDKGNASGTLTGIIYAPDSEMELQDSGGDKSGGLQLVTDLIVNTLFDKTATLSLTSYTQSVPTSPLTSVALVE